MKKLIEKKDQYMFKQILNTQMLISGVVLFVLGLLCTIIMVQISLNQESERLDRDISKLSSYINTRSESSRSSTYSIQRNNRIKEDFIYFTTHTNMEYVKHRLEDYGKSEAFMLQDFFGFMDDWFGNDETLDGILIYTYETGQLREIDRLGNIASYNNLLASDVRTTKDFISTIEGKKTIDTYHYATPIVDFDGQELGILAYAYNLSKIKETVTNETFSGISVERPEGIQLLATGFIEGDKSAMYQNKTDLGYGVSERLNHDVPQVLIRGFLDRKEIIISKLPILVLGWGLLFLFWYLIYLVLQRKVKVFNERLYLILKKMALVGEGKFEDSLVISEKGDELNLIASHFQSMSKELQQMIEDNYTLRVNRSEAELKALQAKMDPHFINNTIEMIRMQAEMDDNLEVSEMLFKLSVLMRDNYRDGDYWTIDKELKYVSSYLDLMCFRFEETLSYSIKTLDSQGSFEIPKLVVQPIVENAIKYGMPSNGKVLNIEIEVSLDEDFIIISVFNNGSPFTKDKLKEVRAVLNSQNYFQLEESIGLKNSQERLKRQCGEASYLSIESNDEQTCVSLVIFKGEERCIY